MASRNHHKIENTKFTYKNIFSEHVMPLIHLFRLPHDRRLIIVEEK